jgi:hypothetical protein
MEEVKGKNPVKVKLLGETSTKKGKTRKNQK